MKVIAKNVRHLSKLTSLDFQIQSFYFLEGGFLASLAKSFRSLPSLEHFGFKAEKCFSWGEDGFIYLIESLDALNPKCIRSLCFDFTRLEFIDAGSEKFRRAEEVWTYLDGNRVDAGVFLQGMNLLTELPNLEELSFSGDESLETDVSEAFGKFIGFIPSLKRFSTKQLGLDEWAFGEITMDLEKLNILEELKLHLR